MEIIIGRQGNQKMPISDLSVSRKHCKVTIDSDETYTIENLSDAGTFVDGVEIIKTKVSPSSRIRLGQSFTATLSELIGTQAHTSPSASPKPPKPSAAGSDKKEFNISHLKIVWDNYAEGRRQLRTRQRKVNLVRSGCGIFTMCAMPCIYFIGPVVGCILTGIGILGNIYSFVGVKNDDSDEACQQLRDKFEDNYICPNPACRKPLPDVAYRRFVKIYSSCPYCKCKYVE